MSNLLNSVDIVYLCDRLTVFNELLEIFLKILKPIIESQQLIIVRPGPRPGQTPAYFPPPGPSETSQRPGGVRRV